MPPSIPDRWIPYKACGKVIEGTRFICFKVPLRKTVQTGNSEIKEIWDVKTLLSKIPNLGAVIDLTNTARYYDPKELQAAGVLHKKILMPGRIIPPEQKVIEFMDAVDEFLGKDCDILVGVHCTHGLNRTGYMVCRYMRDRLGIEGKDAIKRFELARGYQIERENYIADLMGKKAPPPYLGNSTNVNSYNGESWRDECHKREEEESDDTKSPGRYVRHPSKQRQNGRKTRWGIWPEDSSSHEVSSNHEVSTNQGVSSSHEERKSSPRTHKNSTDSDRSYDYRYDY